MNKRTFFIIGKHAVIEALKNPNRKILRVFLTEESKKNIHRENQNHNLLKDIKVYFKTKKELDKYSSKDDILHQEPLHPAWKASVLPLNYTRITQVHSNII